MNKKIMLIVVAIIVALLGVASFMKFLGVKSGQKLSNETIKITHRFGETDVPKNPKRVLVLDYGTVDILDTLGIEIIGLPKDSLPQYLEKYKDEKYADLGGLKEFSFEKINELKPDLIIIEGRQEDSYEELSKIAPTIGLGTDGVNYFESLEKNGKIIGEIFNKNKEVEEELVSINTKMKDLANKIKEKNKNALVTMVSDGNMSVFGKDSRFGMIYKDFGFIEADSDIEAGKHGKNISYEYILEKNPDYIFVIDKGAIVAEGQKQAKEIVENRLVKETKAYKEGNIIYLNPHTWYVGGAGIISANNMIKEIEAVL